MAGSSVDLDTRLLFTVLLALIVLQRLGELALSRRNQEWLLARGGREIGAGHYPAMVVLHSLFLASCLVEVWWWGRPFDLRLALAMLAVLAVATALRYWAIRTLGRRWTTRILLLPDAPRIREGPYRFFSHPNYLAVILEIAALPLVHTAWLTAAVFTVANSTLLAVRVRVEEQGLRGESYTEPT